MEKISQRDIDWLSQPKNNFDVFSTERASFKRPPSKRKKIRYYFVGSLFLLVSLVFTPFFILIRMSVYLNLNQDWNAWMALGGGMGATILFLSLFFLFLFRKVKNRTLFYKVTLLSMTVLVGSFTIYGVGYLKSANAKTEAIREVYNTLHPILRIAVASTTLAEHNLVITDISRTKEDYIEMGLSPRESSYHYMQPTGYVHAVDLRTIGHSELRNVTLKWALTLMGLQTIRHVGTADHLHVALPTNF